MIALKEAQSKSRWREGLKFKIILNFSQKRREKGEGDHRGNISRVFLTHTGIWLVTDLRKDN